MNRPPRWIGFLFLSLFMLFFIILLNWESVSYYVLRTVAQVYGSRLGIALDIGPISGKPFSETTFEEVTIAPEPGQTPTYHLKARSITCRYDLWELRGGVGDFVKGLTCSIIDPIFSYDLRGALPQEQTADQSPQFLVPTVLPGLEVHNGSVILIDNGWKTEIGKLNSSLRTREEAHELLIAAKYFRFSQGGKTRIDSEFTASLCYSGTKLAIDFLALADKQIRATGMLDLARINLGEAELVAELNFAESWLKISGSMAKRLFKARGNTGNFDIGELQKLLGGSGWDISGKIRAEAALAYDLQSPADFESSFSLAVQDGKTNGVDVQALTVSGNIQNEVLSIAKAEAETANNHITIDNASVPLSLVLDSKKLLPILNATQAEFKAEIADIETMLRLFKLEGEVTAQAFLPDSLSFQGKLANGVLYLDDARASAVGASLTFNQGKIHIPTTAEAFETSPVSMTARFESSNLAEQAGLFIDLPVNGQLTVDVAIKGIITKPRMDIKLAGDYLGVNGVSVGSLVLKGNAHLLQEKLGELKLARLRISELSQANDSGTLKLISPATWVWQPELFSLNGRFQVDGQGEFAIEMAKNPSGEITTQITTSKLDSDGWLGNFNDNRYFFHGADLAAVFTGLPQNPQMQLTGTIAAAGATDAPFPLAGRFGLHYSAKGFDISEFTWQSHNGNQLTLSGHLPYDPLAQKPSLDGELSLKGRLDFPALADIALFLEPLAINKGSLVLDMDLAGSGRHPVGHIRLRAEDIDPPETMKQYVDSSMNISCDLEVQGDSLFLRSANLESTAYSAKASGAWRHGTSANEFLQNRHAELKGEVVFDSTVRLKDLNLLRQKLPWLRRVEGDIEGKLHVSGPVTAPQLKGSFTMQDGEASHTFNFPMLSAVNLQGDFDERSISIKNMQAELGGSPVNFSGKINKEQGFFAFDLHVDGRNVLLFRNNDMRIRGDVQLEVTGPLEHLLVKGTTGLTGGYYTRNIDLLGKIGATSAPISEGVSFLFSFPDPPFKNALFDIKITTIEPFRIRNNLIRGVLRPELTLKGTGELPFLVGTIYIDPSRILLPSGRLQIQSGLLRFLEGAPDRPQLDILAQSKVMGYDINVITKGTPDDPVITLSSIPALPNDDLLLLLLTGQLPKQDVAGRAGNSGTRNVMVYMGRDFLTKWLEDDENVSDETLLDRFEIDLGRGVTNGGDLMMESTFRLSKQADRQGKTYYLLGEKDRYDAYNYGLKVVFTLD